VSGHGCLVEFFNLGDIKHTYSKILSVGTAERITCTSFGDFISKHNCGYLQVNININMLKPTGFRV
jgi:hypothetical protein